MSDDGAAAAECLAGGASVSFAIRFAQQISKALALRGERRQLDEAERAAILRDAFEGGAGVGPHDERVV